MTDTTADPGLTRQDYLGLTIGTIPVVVAAATHMWATWSTWTLTVAAAAVLASLIANITEGRPAAVWARAATFVAATHVTVVGSTHIATAFGYTPPWWAGPVAFIPSTVYVWWAVHTQISCNTAPAPARDPVRGALTTIGVKALAIPEEGPDRVRVRGPQRHGTGNTYTIDLDNPHVMAFNPKEKHTES